METPPQTSDTLKIIRFFSAKSLRASRTGSSKENVSQTSHLKEKRAVATALAGDATALTTIPDGGFHGYSDSDETTA
jgi:hypothetical protein